MKKFIICLFSILILCIGAFSMSGCKEYIKNEGTVILQMESLDLDVDVSRTNEEIEKEMRRAKISFNGVTEIIRGWNENTDDQWAVVIFFDSEQTAKTAIEKLENNLDDLSYWNNLYEEDYYKSDFEYAIQDDVVYIGCKFDLSNLEK